jgi:hypothetical protein
MEDAAVAAWRVKLPPLQASKQEAMHARGTSITRTHTRSAAPLDTPFSASLDRRKKPETRLRSLGMDKPPQMQLVHKTRQPTPRTKWRHQSRNLQHNNNLEAGISSRRSRRSLKQHAHVFLIVCSSVTRGREAGNAAIETTATTTKAFGNETTSTREKGRCLCCASLGFVTLFSYTRSLARRRSIQASRSHFMSALACPRKPQTIKLGWKT